ncbi:MAG: DUF167 domain-containing protein [Candidatus Heimdallarchaeota archaeon]
MIKNEGFVVTQEYLASANNGIRVKIVVKPNSKQPGIKIDTEKKYLQISVKSPPDKGKANKELLKLLAKQLELSLANLSIISGQRSRDKIILVANVSLEDLQKKIEKI